VPARPHPHHSSESAWGRDQGCTCRSHLGCFPHWLFWGGVQETIILVLREVSLAVEVEFKGGNDKKIASTPEGEAALMGADQLRTYTLILEKIHFDSPVAGDRLGEVLKWMAPLLKELHEGAVRMKMESLGKRINPIRVTIESGAGLYVTALPPKSPPPSTTGSVHFPETPTPSPKTASARPGAGIRAVISVPGLSKLRRLFRQPCQRSSESGKSPTQSPAVDRS
jgi:hypothetical protein